MTEPIFTRVNAIDRAGWPRGPWDDEPEDVIAWFDPETLLPCVLNRHPRQGHWCGYVGVTSEPNTPAVVMSTQRGPILRAILTPATLSTIRRALGLSTRRLGDLMRPSVNFRTIAAWEAGTKPIPPGAVREVLEIEAEVRRLAEATEAQMGETGPWTLTRLREVDGLREDIRPRAVELHLAALAWLRAEYGEGVTVIDQEGESS